MNFYHEVMFYLGIVLGVLSSYHVVYLMVGFFSKPVLYKDTDIKKKYAIIIPARNEEKVIGNLIESIRKQTYDASLITIFVVADNCADNTVEIARQMGCVVYERCEPKKARKGYALSFLFEHIKKDYGIESFDGYLIFDADNLLSPTYMVEMNKAFVAHPYVITSYRNTKNFDTNMVTSAYGIHFYRSTVAFHRPRQVLHVGTHLAGTGYVISSHLLKDGWRYTELTEDTELTIDLTTQNIKVAFCEAAVFYDEQPTQFKVAFRQRVRWTKGRINVYFKRIFKLIKGAIKHHTFTTYDMLYYLTPWDILNLVRRLVSIGFAISVIVAAANGWIGIQKALWVELGIIGGNYLINLLFGAATVIREYPQIKCSKIKLIFYVFTYPWFNLLSGVLTLVALLKPRVKWTPIDHDDSRKIDDIIKP